MLDRLYATLDNRLLSRIGNATVLISVGGFVGSVLVALVVALVYLLTHVGWVPLLFLGLALLLALLNVLTRFRERKEQREHAHDPIVIAVAERLQTVADQIEALYHARDVEEPRRFQPPGVTLPLQFEGEDEHYETLAEYRKKTMALYYERHRADAVNAFDACAEYTRGRERERSIIYKPNGTAAMALVPGILRDMGWKLIG
jgi:hypothetical protein